MTPIHHSLCNDVLRRPEGLTEEECGDLPIFRNDTCVVSFWRPEPAELQALAAGQPIMLAIASQTHPPLSVSVLAVDSAESAG
jgi:hypothetical protein